MRKLSVTLGACTATLFVVGLVAAANLTGTWELRRAAVAITLKEEDPTRARLIDKRPQWTQN